MDNWNKIECWDWDRLSKDDFIGATEVQIEKLLEDIAKGEKSFSFPLINPEKANKKKNYTDSGKIFLGEVKIVKEYSFLDYIQSGLDMKLMVAIDFTASNGNFNHPGKVIDFIIICQLPSIFTTQTTQGSLFQAQNNYL